MRCEVSSRTFGGHEIETFVDPETGNRILRRIYHKRSPRVAPETVYLEDGRWLQTRFGLEGKVAAQSRSGSTDNARERPPWWMKGDL